MAGSALTASAWTVAARWVRHASQLLLYVVLARVMAPHEYGAIALAGLVLMLLQAIAEGGVGDLIVQRPALADAQLRAARATNAMLGTIAAAACFLLAAPTAAAFNAPAAERLLHVLAMVPLLVGQTQVAMGQLRRGLRFRAVAAIQAGAVIAGALAGIAVTVATDGATGFIAYHLVQAAVALVAATLATGVGQVFAWSWPGGHGLGGATMRNVGTAATMGLRSMVPAAAAGLLLGPAALGQLALAQRVAGAAADGVRNPVIDTAFPFLARLQGDDARAARAWAKATALILLVLAPVFMGLALTSHDLIAVLVGPGWHRAGMALCAWGLAYVIALPASLGEPSLKARGGWGLLLGLQVVFLGIDVVAVALFGWTFGFVGIVLSAPLRSVITTLATLRFTAPAGSAKELLATLARTWLTVAGLSVAVLALMALTPSWAPLGRLMAAVAVGVATYVLLAWRLLPSAVASLRHALQRRRGGLANDL